MPGKYAFSTKSFQPHETFKVKMIETFFLAGVCVEKSLQGINETK